MYPPSNAPTRTHDRFKNREIAIRVKSEQEMHYLNYRNHHPTLQVFFRHFTLGPYAE